MSSMCSSRRRAALAGAERTASARWGRPIGCPAATRAEIAASSRARPCSRKRVGHAQSAPLAVGQEVGEGRSESGVGVVDQIAEDVQFARGSRRRPAKRGRRSRRSPRRGRREHRAARPPPRPRRRPRRCRGRTAPKARRRRRRRGRRPRRPAARRRSGSSEIAGQRRAPRGGEPMRSEKSATRGGLSGDRPARSGFPVD